MPFSPSRKGFSLAALTVGHPGWPPVNAANEKHSSDRGKGIEKGGGGEGMVRGGERTCSFIGIAHFSPNSDSNRGFSMMLLIRILNPAPLRPYQKSCPRSCLRWCPPGAPAGAPRGAPVVLPRCPPWFPADPRGTSVVPPWCSRGAPVVPPRCPRGAPAVPQRCPCGAHGSVALVPPVVPPRCPRGAPVVHLAVPPWCPRGAPLKLSVPLSSPSSLLGVVLHRCHSSLQPKFFLQPNMFLHVPLAEIEGSDTATESPRKGEDRPHDVTERRCRGRRSAPLQRGKRCAESTAPRRTHGY